MGQPLVSSRSLIRDRNPVERAKRLALFPPRRAGLGLGQGGFLLHMAHGVDRAIMLADLRQAGLAASTGENFFLA